MAHPDANRKMHYVIEKSNKILGEEKEKTEGEHTVYTGCFFYCSALKMTKYKEKLKYPKCSANCFKSQ